MTQKDTKILRNLANAYMEVATLPVQNEKVELWKSLNAGKMQRPMVTICQLPWHELNGDGELTLHVEDPVFRQVENEMRQLLYKWKNFPADMVVEPIIPIPMAISGFDYGMEVQEDISVSDAANSVVSHYYTNQFETFEDVAKIKDMQITHDEAETNRRMELANEIFAGIAPVRPKGHIFHLGPWDNLSTWMGIEAVYMELVDNPELMHALVRRHTDAIIAGLKQANALGVVDSQSNLCHCSHIYTNELLPGPGAGGAQTTYNSWGFGLAQPFTSVSPATTKEFEIPYITEMAKYFGGIYYGCCDRLCDRMDMVKQIPNVRKLSCSPWSDREKFAEQIGPTLTMSAKPNPAFVANSLIDYDVIENDLRETVEAARRHNVNLEFILKDVSTVQYQPQRLQKWNEIVMKVVEA